MAIVVVAGGTGKLGRAVVEALRDTTNHSVSVLTRKVRRLVLTRIKEHHMLARHFADPGMI